MAVNDVAEYWIQQLETLHSKWSLVEDQESTLEVLRSGRTLITAKLWLDHICFLGVLEQVVILSGGIPHREKYSYHLQIDGQHEPYIRWDFNPAKTKPLQYHINRPGSGGEILHEPSERITITKVAEAAWKEYAEWRDSGLI